MTRNPAVAHDTTINPQRNRQRHGLTRAPRPQALACARQIPPHRGSCDAQAATPFHAPCSRRQPNIEPLFGAGTMPRPHQVAEGQQKGAVSFHSRPRVFLTTDGSTVSDHWCGLRLHLQVRPDPTRRRPARSSNHCVRPPLSPARPTLLDDDRHLAETHVVLLATWVTSSLDLSEHLLVHVPILA